MSTANGILVKWAHGPKPAVPWWLNFDPYPCQKTDPAALRGHLEPLSLSLLPTCSCDIQKPGVVPRRRFLTHAHPGTMFWCCVFFRRLVKSNWSKLWESLAEQPKPRGRPCSGWQRALCEQHLCSSIAMGLGQKLPKMEPPGNGNVGQNLRC